MAELLPLEQNFGNAGIKKSILKFDISDVQFLILFPANVLLS